MFILLLFYYWLLVSASQGHHQASIYKKLKMLEHIVQKYQFYRTIFAFISGLVIIVNITNECKWEPIKLTFLYYMYQHFKFFFGKYWPDDGLLRPKLSSQQQNNNEIHV
jgi:hypothetical protein